MRVMLTTSWRLMQFEEPSLVAVDSKVEKLIFVNLHSSRFFAEFCDYNLCRTFKMSRIRLYEDVLQ